VPEAPAPAGELIGSMVAGRYLIEREIGGGTAGKVYEATQQPIGRKVALKVLRPELRSEDGDTFEKRFMREAALTGALQHPNIVTVHDFGRTPEGWCYTVMELIRGADLRTEMRKGPMSLPFALDIFEQIVRGLGCAHEAGLVHRDVKPANIVLMEGYQGRRVVKILDFGLVKDSEDAGLTTQGTMMGTPRYMPPEQAKGEAVDHRADLYSVGVMMYEGLTGVSPYEASTAMTMALCHIREPYPPMAERVPGVPVPAEVEAVVKRCMAKNPDGRFNGATHLLAELFILREKLESGAFDDAPSGSMTPLWKRGKPAAAPAKPSRAERADPLASPVVRGLLLAAPISMLLAFGFWLVSSIDYSSGPGPEDVVVDAPSEPAVEVDREALAAELLTKRPRKRTTRRTKPQADGTDEAEGLPAIAPEASLDGGSKQADISMFAGRWSASDGADGSLVVDLRLKPDGSIVGSLEQTGEDARTTGVAGFYKPVGGDIEVHLAELGGGGSWSGVLRDDGTGRLQPKGGTAWTVRKR
jgi:hypothetical protein